MKTVFVVFVIDVVLARTVRAKANSFKDVAKHYQGLQVINLCQENSDRPFDIEV